MELQASSYFYALAQLALVFVGVGTLAVALRQNMGKKLSKFQVFLTRVFIESGLMATAFAMLAPTLALSTMKEALVWRGTSTLMLLILLPWAIAYPFRRKIASSAKTPPRVYIMFVLGLLTTAGLALNATGLIIEPGPVPIAIATIYVMVFASVAFLFTYKLFLRN